MNQATDDTLLTLNDSGTPPETRIGNANQALNIFQSLWKADELRALRRQRVKGLVDGNPPYRQADLKNAGMDYKCNVNWRIAESYLNAAVGAFYDLFSEAATYATVKLKRHKDYSQEQMEGWSRTVSTHFDWLLRYEPSFDYNIQRSQNEMVMYGVGPLVFEDKLDWKPKSILAGQLKVEERTLSNTEYWELATIEMDYQCDELWRKIRNEKEASSMGWNVERVKQAIIHASPDFQRGGMYRNWEWHQQQLKNGSIEYSRTAKVINVAHIFFREFAKEGQSKGKVTHLIIIRDDKGEQTDTFLFQKIGRYDDWPQSIHPMYYDVGGGGFHHSVTGMGVKMYSAMEYQNRLLCNNADKAFTPKLMFKPTTSTGVDNFSLQQHGDYAVLAEGYEAVQTPVAGFMEEGIMFNREITNLVASNLSQYRSNTTEPVKGNPDTATKVKLDASKEASLQKTQMNRYYQQQDGFYSEMYRRAAQSGVLDSRAKEFQKRCKEDGVPEACMREVEFVKATRVIGQGSQFMREQSIERIMAVVGMLPEGGRTHLLNDYIAALAGQTAVERYNPSKEISKLPDDQYAWAMSQVADMKTGVPAIPTDNQNPMIFAQTFLQAADQAAGSLEQGADPVEVVAFLDLCGQAIAIHLQRLSTDPTRKEVVKAMEKQFQQLAQVTDQLHQAIEQQQQEQAQKQQQMAEQRAAMESEFALAKEKQDFDLRLKADKTAFGMQDKGMKTRQQMILADAKTASDIRRQNLQAEVDRRNKERNGSEK